MQNTNHRTPADILMHPGRYTARGLATGQAACAALRGWAGMQLARAHLASGDLDDAAGALAQLSHIAERAPADLSRRLARQCDRLAAEIGRAAAGGTA